MSIAIIKASVLAYWRYARQCPLVALEANSQLGGYTDGGRADILVVTPGRRLVEVEVKTSMADFRKDVKKEKHEAFTRVYRGEKPWRMYPHHYFYFAVPVALANEVSLACDQLYPYAGVIGVANEIRQMMEENCTFHRKPTSLGGDKLSLLQVTRMAKEQSGTLCRLARELAKSGNKGNSP